MGHPINGTTFVSDNKTNPSVFKSILLSFDAPLKKSSISDNTALLIPHGNSLDDALN